MHSQTDVAPNRGNSAVAADGVPRYPIFGVDVALHPTDRPVLHFFPGDMRV